MAPRTVSSRRSDRGREHAAMLTATPPAAPRFDSCEIYSVETATSALGLEPTRRRKGFQEKSRAGPAGQLRPEAVRLDACLQLFQPLLQGRTAPRGEVPA